MSLQDLILKQKKLRPFLLKGYYAFIGPADPNMFEQFIKVVNRLAPTRSFFDNSIHDALSNDEAVLKALEYFPNNLPLRIFVMSSKSDTFLVHDTVENYCREHDIILKD